MSSLLRLIQAEAFKWKREWVLLAALLVPFTQSLVLSIILGFSGDRRTILGGGYLAWYRVSFIAWNLIFMPLWAALVPALSWDLEERSGAWKHLLAMPVGRLQLFWGKLLGQVLLALMGQAFLVVCIVAGGRLLSVYDPGLPMGPLELGYLYHIVIYSLLAMLPVLAVHAWWSSRWPGLGGNLALAVFGIWFAFELNTRPEWIAVMPWGLAGQVTNLTLRGRIPSDGMYITSLVCALVLILAGAADFRWRNLERKD